MPVDVVVHRGLEERRGRHLEAPLSAGDGLPAWEQLWSRLSAARRATLCCIRFAAYDLHLGDEVEFDDNYTIVAVVHRSAYFTFRLWLAETP